MAVGARGPAMPQVGSDGLTDIGRQWHEALVTVLATHAQAAGVPIDVLQQQRDDLAASQTQARQQQQDRPVAPADRGTRVAARDSAASISPRYRAKRRKARNAVMTFLSPRGRRLRACCRTKPTMSVALTALRSTL